MKFHTKTNLIMKFHTKTNLIHFHLM